MPSEIEPDDIVQIDPENRTFHGCLAIVDEVRSWGVLAGVIMPQGIAYVRIANGKFTKVGHAAWRWRMSDDTWSSTRG